MPSRSLALALTFDQRQFAEYAGIRLQLTDIPDIHKLTDLLFNLIEDFIISAGYNGNPGKTRISRYACSNAFNIVTPSENSPEIRLNTPEVLSTIS